MRLTACSCAIPVDSREQGVPWSGHVWRQAHRTAEAAGCEGAQQLRLAVSVRTREADGGPAAGADGGERRVASGLPRTPEAAEDFLHAGTVTLESSFTQTTPVQHRQCNFMCFCGCGFFMCASVVVCDGVDTGLVCAVLERFEAP